MMENKSRLLLRQLAPTIQHESKVAINVMTLEGKDYAISRDDHGRVNAIFHRGLKTAEAKL